jgi:hypothetical protein
MDVLPQTQCTITSMTTIHTTITTTTTTMLPYIIIESDGRKAGEKAKEGGVCSAAVAVNWEATEPRQPCWQARMSKGCLGPASASSCSLQCWG